MGEAGANERGSIPLLPSQAMGERIANKAAEREERARVMWERRKVV
jgi:hypothetical protein